MPAKQPPTWTNENRKLGDLKKWPDNPRYSTKDDAAAIVESYEDFGQTHLLLISPDNELYDGHQRLDSWLAKYGADFVVDVRVSSYRLSDRQRRKLVADLHIKATGQWNWDVLAGWGDDLKDWGFDKNTLKEWNNDANNLKEMLAASDGDGEQDGDNYSRKIEPPEYMITGVKPVLGQLFDKSKTEKLIRDIDAAPGIPDDEKDFLRIAAQRHTVLNFKMIAEYYAHAAPELQALMEDSALVIIDFQKAISLGFVELTQNIAALVSEEYGDD